MMKRLGFLIVGLLFGIMLSPSAFALQDGIYEVLDGKAKTLKSGDVALTIAMEDLPGLYHWGFNENTGNSEWIGDYYTAGTGTYYIGGKMYGNTNGVENNNIWGGGNDTPENGYDSGNDRTERQGPCQTGWHVPSGGEFRNFLVTWCVLDEDCDVDNSLDLDYFSDYLGTGNGVALWSVTHILYKFNFTGGFYGYLTSSPFGTGFFYASFFDGSDWYTNDAYRGIPYYIRCFKDEPITEFSVSFDVDGIITNENVSLLEQVSKPADPQLTGHTFKYRHLTGSDAEFDFNAPITGDTILYAKFEVNHYTITFVDGSGNNKDVVYTGAYGSDTSTLTYPSWTKDGYTINWSDTIPTTMPLNGMTITATRTKDKTSSGGSSGGGGGMRKDNCSDGDLSPSYYDGECGSDNNTGNVIQSESQGSEESSNDSDTIVDSSDKFSEGQDDASIIKGGGEQSELEG